MSISALYIADNEVLHTINFARVETNEKSRNKCCTNDVPRFC